MESSQNSKYSCSYRHCIILAVVFLSISIFVFITIHVIQAKKNTRTSVINEPNMTNIHQKYNMSIKGLLSLETIVQTNICDKNQSLEDCVLIYNANLFMKALLSIPSALSNYSSISSIFPANATNSTIDYKILRLRRRQLSQIFDSITLETIYNVSGIPYSSNDNPTPSDQEEPRSQIDARSIRSRWDTTINYFINQATGFTPSMIANIHTAISNWENNTCLKFNELSEITPTTNKSFIRFDRDDQYGCSSAVGYDSTDPTSVILISVYCGSVMVSIMHEIGHTLGYIHTQSRIDRNSYVSIVTDNIQQDFIGNFFMWTYGTIRFSDVNFPYEYGSMMHYEAYAFSNNNQPTIIPYDSRYEKTMGQRDRATFYDYKQINRLYCMRQDCPQMFNNNDCKNNGYLDPKTCTYCVCPDGFSGTYCDQPDSNSNCGDTIINLTPSLSAQITIENPLPPNATSTQQYCVYLIRSLTPRKIRLRLDSIDTIKRSVCSSTSSLEVKYLSDLALTGARSCGNTIASNWSNVTAETNTMLIIFRANNSINNTTGKPQASFRATIFFDAEPTDIVSSTTTVSSTSTRTTLTMLTTNILTTTQTAPSRCPSSSFRCQLPSQPTCGGCLNYQPCITQGSQLCAAYTYQAQLTDCDKIVNGVAQCRYRFVPKDSIMT